MRRFVLAILIAVFVSSWAPCAPYALGQTFTTDQILAKLDEKAKVFTSLQTSLSKQQNVHGYLPSPDIGTLTIALAQGTPRILLDITSKPLQRALIDKGKATLYFPGDNTYRQASVDPKSEQLMLLLLGFGTPAETIRRGYSPQAKGTETVAGVQTVALELKSISKTTDAYPTVTLWLDPQTWIPVKTRLAEAPTKYYEFVYSKVVLNKPLGNSAFDLKMKGDAKKQ